MFNKKIVAYVKAGPLLHSITIIEIACFSCLYLSFDVISWLMGEFFLLKLIILSPTVCMPVFAQLDARSRYQNYKLVKDLLHQYGFQTRIVKPFIKSRCQRDAIKAAANDLGLEGECVHYFRVNGYKWYHLFPDVIFEDPGILLTKNFWVTTLFAKKYFPKTDFEKIEPGYLARKERAATIKLSSSF